MEMMSLPLETGYKCKICDGYIFGYYVWMEQKMYFRGKLQTYLVEFFNYKTC